MRYADSIDLPAPVRGSIELHFVDRIGTGGFASVYRARQVGLDRLVAVKVLHPTADPEARRQFVEESRILARMPPHPAIVGVHANVTVDGVDHVVMELVTGGTLEDRLARGSIGQPEAVAIAIWLAAALASAHSFGIVHGDIKASNVLLTPSGHPKLADFGSAVMGSGGVPRTPSSTAPEVLLGGETSVRSDVYSLGCLLDRCLGPERSIDALTRLVSEMVDVDPGSRPAPMDAVLDRLRAIERAEGWPRTPAVVVAAEDDALEPVHHTAEPTLDPDHGVRRPSRWWVPIVGLVVAGAVVGGFVVGRTSAPPPVDRSAVEGPAVDDESVFEQQGIGPYTVVSFEADPSLTRPASRTANQRLDAVRDGLTTTLGGEAHPIRLTGGQALGLPQRPGRIRIQAFNNTRGVPGCFAMRSGELDLVESGDSGWQLTADGRSPLLAVAWVTRLASAADAHVVFEMHALHAGLTAAECNNGGGARIDPDTLAVEPSTPRPAALAAADDAGLFHTDKGLAIVARADDLVGAVVIAGAEVTDEQVEALAATLRDAIAP